MSFGDKSGPMGRVIGGAVNTFDAVLGPAFKSDPAKPVPPSLLNSPEPQANPAKAKSLLGA